MKIVDDCEARNWKGTTQARSVEKETVRTGLIVTSILTIKKMRPGHQSRSMNKFLWLRYQGLEQ